MKTVSGSVRRAADPSFDVVKVRADFPALGQKVYDKPLIYLDNAATTQKPQAVIDAIVGFYTGNCANIHRGVHILSERATRDYEASRTRIKHFIHAADEKEIVFVRGATEAINLLAQSFARPRLQSGDEILISAVEHHSNIVPWQIICEEKGAHLRVIPMNRRGELQMDAYDNLLSPRTRLVSIAHVSNALGTVNPVRRMIEMAHRRDIPVLVDGAQAIPHTSVDVSQLDCDFYAFSGHKMYGPTGVGVLYGKSALLEEMPPYQGGGDMISSVTFDKTLYNRIPYKFEAGTPHIAGGIALGAAVAYLEGIGMERIAAYEHGLLQYATEAFMRLPGVQLIGTAADKAGVLSFVVEGVHPHDVGTILDQEGIAIRTGHHCAQPVMEYFNLPATARASLSFYNTREEIDALVAGVRKVSEVFS